MGASSSKVSEEWIQKTLENRLKAFEKERIENRLKVFEAQSLPDFKPLPSDDETCPKGGVLMKVGTSTMKLCHGSDGSDGHDAPTPVVTPLDVGHEKCSNGGVQIDMNGKIDYVCAGQDGAVPTVTAIAKKDDDCPYGGTEMMVGSEKVKICDGKDGIDGLDGAIPTLNSFGANEHGCGEEGGVKVDMQIGDKVQSSVICAASDGKNPVVDVLEVGDEDCPNGGTRMTVGDDVVNMCNGADGADGADGAPAPEMKTETIAVGDNDRCGGRGGIELFIGGVSEQIICTAENGKTPTTETVPPNHRGCGKYGGVAISIGDDVEIICNGEDGSDGADGAPGADAKEVTVKKLEAGSTQCPIAGGVEIFVGDESQQVICEKQDGRTPKTKILLEGEEGCEEGGVGVYIAPPMSVKKAEQCIEIFMGGETCLTTVCAEDGKEATSRMLSRGEEGCEEGGVAVYIDGAKSKVVCNKALLSDVICNPRDGVDGDDGADAKNVTTKTLESGDTRCEGRGGVEIFLDEESQEVICTAKNGKTPETKRLPPNHEGCELGGIAIYIGGTLSDVVCDPADGKDGIDGGTPPTPVVAPVAPGVDEDCPDGGLRITVGEKDNAVSEVVCPKNGKAPKTIPIGPGGDCEHGGVKIENSDGTVEFICQIKGDRGMQGIIGDKGPQGERGPRGQAAPTLCRSGEFERSPPYLNFNRVCTVCPNGYWFDPDKVVKTENGKTCKSVWVDPDNKAHTNENPCSLSPTPGSDPEKNSSAGKPWCETTDGSWDHCEVNSRERCAKHTECTSDEYEVEAPSNSIDRTCAPLEDCVGNNQYIHKFSKPNLNRVCASCDATQWLDKSDPTSIKTLPPEHPEYGDSTSGGANCLTSFTYEGKTYNNTCVIPEDGSKPWCVTSSIGNQSKWGYCDEKETRCKTPLKCDASKKQYQTKAFTPVSDTKCGQCGENQWLNTFTKKCMNYSECNAGKGYFLKSNPATRPRECQQCPSGQYRDGDQCKSYRTCPPGHFIKVQGDKAKDHTCEECPSGAYEKNGECKPHTPCVAGTVQDRAPSSTQDRTCKSCDNGYFESNGVCKQYRTCPWNQVQKTAGTSTTDRTCKSCGSNYYISNGQCLSRKTCASDLVTIRGNATTNDSCKRCEDHGQYKYGNACYNRDLSQLRSGAQGYMYADFKSGSRYYRCGVDISNGPPGRNGESGSTTKHRYQAKISCQDCGSSANGLNSTCGYSKAGKIWRGTGSNKDKLYMKRYYGSSSWTCGLTRTARRRSEVNNDYEAMWDCDGSGDTLETISGTTIKEGAFPMQFGAWDKGFAVSRWQRPLKFDYNKGKADKFWFRRTG